MSVVKKSNSPYFASLIDELLRPDLGGRQMQTKQPPVNILEDENEFVLELSVPGFSKEEINIELENDLFTISSKEKVGESLNGQKYSRREFFMTSFKRSFTLPDTVNQEEIAAKFENGILRITLPKKQEAAPKEKKLIQIF